MIEISEEPVLVEELPDEPISEYARHTMACISELFLGGCSDMHFTKFFDSDEKRNPAVSHDFLPPAGIDTMGYVVSNAVSKYHVGPYPIGTRFENIVFDPERNLVEAETEDPLGMALLAFRYRIGGLTHDPVDGARANVWEHLPGIMLCYWNECATDELVRVNIVGDHVWACRNCAPVDLMMRPDPLSTREWLEVVPLTNEHSSTIRYVALQERIESLFREIHIYARSGAMAGQLCGEDLPRGAEYSFTCTGVCLRDFIGIANRRFISDITIDFGRGIAQVICDHDQIYRNVTLPDDRANYTSLNDVRTYQIYENARNEMDFMPMPWMLCTLCNERSHMVFLLSAGFSVEHYACKRCMPMYEQKSKRIRRMDVD